MDDPFARARTFLLTHARLLERVLFAARFEGGSPHAVADAVRAYRNPDGGLGQALEPDLRCVESQPLCAEVGLAALWQAGCRDADLGLSVCGFLGTACDEDGLVPPFAESARRSPLAPHWSSPVAAGLNPTVGLCGLLHYQGVEHPWLTRATRCCCERVLADPPREAHALLGIARLADHLPDRSLAGRLADAVRDALPEAAFFIARAPVTTYGLTPLHFAPGPASPWRSAFGDAQIEGHLRDLLGRQQADGGWPIHWQPPGPAALCEWRGRAALEAIATLASYGWLGPQRPA